MSNTLTILKLVATGALVGRTEGQRNLAAFVDTVDRRGEVPQEVLQWLADSLRPLIDPHNKGTMQKKIADAAKNLGVTAKQGKQLSAEVEGLAIARCLVDYYEKVKQLHAEGLYYDRAEQEALRWYLKKVGIAQRAAKNRIAKHGESAQVLLKCRARYNEFMRIIEEQEQLKK